MNIANNGQFLDVLALNASLKSLNLKKILLIFLTKVVVAVMSKSEFESKIHKLSMSISIIHIFSIQCIKGYKLWDAVEQVDT